MKDERADKMDFARKYIGVRESDMPNLGENLLPRIPQILMDRRIDTSHFASDFFTNELKLDFLSSVSALGESNAILTSPDYEAYWLNTPKCDPQDSSFRGPVGYKAKL